LAGGREVPRGREVAHAARRSGRHPPVVGGARRQREGGALGRGCGLVLPHHLVRPDTEARLRSNLKQVLIRAGACRPLELRGLAALTHLRCRRRCAGREARLRHLRGGQEPGIRRVSATRHVDRHQREPS
jgi:hypothetical protein